MVCHLFAAYCGRHRLTPAQTLCQPLNSSGAGPHTSIPPGRKRALGRRRRPAAPTEPQAGQRRLSLVLSSPCRWEHVAQSTRRTGPGAAPSSPATFSRAPLVLPNQTVRRGRSAAAQHEAGIVPAGSDPAGKGWWRSAAPGRAAGPAQPGRQAGTVCGVVPCLASMASAPELSPRGPISSKSA